MSAIEKVIEHYGCISDDASNYVACEKARAELTALREKAEWSDKYRKQMVAFRDRAEELDALVGPLVECLENTLPSDCFNGEKDGRCDDCDYAVCDTITNARAVLEGDGDEPNCTPTS